MAHTGSVEARDLRVSDAEREHVGQLLQRAVGMGMLSLGEFTERMDTALAAKTRGELNAVLVDLPGMRIVETVEHGAPTRVASAPETVRGWMSNVERKGPWQVPPTLHTATRMSNVTLDFTAAVMSTQVVEVIVDDVASSLTLVVPDAATVDLGGLDLVGSNATSKVRSGPPGPLHLVVRGKVRWGSVTAKHPFGTTWRKLVGQTSA